MYTKQQRFDYTLYDAFNTLGVWLYGSEWTGYELQGYRADDPNPRLEAKVPLRAEIDRIHSQIQEKEVELKAVLGRTEVARVNHEILILNDQFDEAYVEFNKIERVDDGEIRDFQKWEQFEKAEGIFLKALRNGELSVYCLSHFVVEAELWLKMPQGFSYDFHRSLIFWPSNKSSLKVDVGRIQEKQFEAWLNTILPVVPDEIEKLSDEKQASIELGELVNNWDGKHSKAQYKEDLMDKFTKLSGKGFDRIWNKHATDKMKTSGRRKGT